LLIGHLHCHVTCKNPFLLFTELVTPTIPQRLSSEGGAGKGFV
jgi:hypothetical protein